MRVLTPWLILALVGSAAIIGASYLVTWGSEEVLPAMRRKLHPMSGARGSVRYRFLQSGFMALLIVAYGCMLWYGLAARSVEHLLGAHLLYIGLWGALLARMSVARQLRVGGRYYLEVSFDTDRVAKRQRRLNAAMLGFAIISVLFVSIWLMPDIAARAHVLRLVAHYLSEVGASVGAVAALLVALLIGATLFVAWLDSRSGASLVDDLFALMQSVPSGPAPSIPGVAAPPVVLAHAVQAAQARTAIDILLRLERDARAASVSLPDGTTDDLWGRIPWEVKHLIEELRKVHPETADRYANLVESIIENLKESNAKRAGEWELAFA